jgi:hypothetical protein
MNFYLRNSHLLFLLFFLVQFWSCNKSKDRLASVQQNTIESAKRFFESNLLPSDISKSFRGNIKDHLLSDLLCYPDWERAQLFDIHNTTAVAIPVKFNQLILYSSNAGGTSSNNKLLLLKAGNGWNVQLLTFIPDSNMPKSSSGKFNGIIVVKSMTGTLETCQYIENGKRIKTAELNASRSTLAESQLESQTVCIYAEGFNYSKEDPDGSYWRELIGCYTFFPDPLQATKTPDYGPIGGGGGSGGTMYPSILDFIVPSPDNPISDIPEYMKCFINKPGTDYEYQVSICVSQPEPGSRTPWTGTAPWNNDNNPFFVGHSYLILSQKTPTGTIIRNIGFYPGGNVSPSSPRSPGIFNNDQNRGYDIKLTITMNNSQFYTILGFITDMQRNGTEYNLNANNCSTFAINAVNAAGFQLAKTYGSWYRGGGCNPGDLGEDLRSMPLGSNMTRTTTEGTHPNTGTCQ